jgi:predicted DNA-binding transcriptional regulator AlpA
MSDTVNSQKTRHHLYGRADQILQYATGEDDDLLSTPQLAKLLGVSEQWVEIGRIKNYGPPYIRLSPRKIRYRRSAVLDWLKANIHQCTAEYEKPRRKRLSD